LTRYKCKIHPEWVLNVDDKNIKQDRGYEEKDGIGLGIGI
jgi:hypothetical protein